MTWTPSGFRGKATHLGAMDGSPVCGRVPKAVAATSAIDAKVDCSWCRKRIASAVCLGCLRGLDLDLGCHYGNDGTPAMVCKKP